MYLKLFSKTISNHESKKYWKINIIKTLNRTKSRGKSLTSHKIRKICREKAFHIRKDKTKGGKWSKEEEAAPIMKRGLVFLYQHKNKKKMRDNEFFYTNFNQILEKVHKSYKGTTRLCICISK
jgi:hypothetical protein